MGNVPGVIASPDAIGAWQSQGHDPENRLRWYCSLIYPGINLALIVLPGTVLFLLFTFGLAIQALTVLFLLIT
ncbi:MAG: hypothetical protein WCA51_09055 [Dehalococcoidia bacterium]